MAVTRSRMAVALLVVVALGFSGSTAAASTRATAQLCPLFAPADVAANDRFGSSIGVDGGVAAVGSWLGDAGELRNAGAVYLFELQADGNWVETQKLLASNAEIDAGFGFAVDLEGGLLAVSAQNETVIANGQSVPGAGAVYLFERLADGSWVEVARLTEPTPSVDALFGYNLEVVDGSGPDTGAGSGNATVVVGAPGANSSATTGAPAIEAGGAAHVFGRDGTGRWVHEAALIDPEAQPNDRAGNDVAISGDWVVVGQHLDDKADGANRNNAGGALVYRRVGNEWTGPTELSGSDPQVRDRAGIGVDVDADTIVMTGWAQNDDDRAVAWVFARNGDQWVEQARIEPDTTGPGASTSPGSHFGRHVELQDGVLAIGASLDDEAQPDGGAVHYYTESDGFWLERAKISPTDVNAGEMAGISLALSTQWAAIGAERAAIGVPNSGAVCFASLERVLDGSYAPDRRLSATAAVAAPIAPSTTGSGGLPLVAVGSAVGVAVVAVGALFLRRQARRG